MSQPQPDPALKAGQRIAKGPRNCPVCHSGLSPFQFHAVETDVCKQGCGLWLDEHELSHLEQSDTLENIDRAFAGTFQRANVPQALENVPDRQCPEHRIPMDRYEWNVGSGVVLDQCPECRGIWLDGGELEGYSQSIKRFYESPPELTPELKAKLDLAKAELDAEWARSMEKASQAAVPWDLWFLDDLRRHLIKTVLGRLN